MGRAESNAASMGWRRSSVRPVDRVFVFEPAGAGSVRDASVKQSMARHRCLVSQRATLFRLSVVVRLRGPERE